MTPEKRERDAVEKTSGWEERGRGLARQNIFPSQPPIIFFLLKQIQPIKMQNIKVCAIIIDQSKSENFCISYSRPIFADFGANFLFRKFSLCDWSKLIT